MLCQSLRVKERYIMFHPSAWQNLGFPHNNLDLNNKFLSNSVNDGPIGHYHTPVTTSTSVLGLAFDNGVMIAADTLGSYGSLARFKNISRVLKVNKNIILGVGGDYADFQYLKELVNGKMIGEECLEDNIPLKPASLHCWLTRVLYQRRSKVDPLWNNVLIAGIQKEIPYLGYIDKLGTAVQDKVIATGYGAHIAVPLLRDGYQKKPKMNKKDAEDLIVKCMEVLYCRDARSFNRYELAIITPDEVEIKGPIDIKVNWEISQAVSGYE